MMSKHAQNMPLATISYQKSCFRSMHGHGSTGVFLVGEKRHRPSSVHLLPVSSCASS